MMREIMKAVPKEAILEPPTRTAVRDVVLNMRLADWREIFCCRAGDDAESFVDEMILHCAAGFCAYVARAVGEAAPVAVIGVAALTPVVGSAFMFATDQFDEIGWSLTRRLKSEIVPGLRRAGLARVECRAWEGNSAALRWLRHLGAKPEAVLRGYGRDGETFIQMAWTRAAVERGQKARRLESCA